MKKLYTILVAILLTASTFAQVPEKMSYQAVVRDSGDNLVSSQPVGMQISILQTTATGTAVYVETQTPTTNVNGLVTLEIGTGSLVSGNFTTIDWSADTYFIKIETDPTGGSNYTITGTSQLLSVPYALHAKTAGSVTETQTLSNVLVLGNTADAQIKNVTDPTDAQDAATKAYVDAQDAAIALNTAKLGTVGDIKQGFQAADHSGWVKLDGRVVSSLTATQQTEATTLGFTVNLPDASNTFLVQNGNTLGSVSGSNTKTVSQANLPNVDFLGTTATAGNHTHGIVESDHFIAHSQTPTAVGGFAPGGLYGPNTTFKSVTIEAAGDHTHTVSVSSGGSGTALDITPKSLSINTFVYLGN